MHVDAFVVVCYICGCIYILLHKNMIILPCILCLISYLPPSMHYHIRTTLGIFESILVV